MENFNKYNTLDTINQLINNCDTKVSVFLAMYGVLMTILLSSDLGIWVAGVIKMNMDNKTISSIVYLLIFLAGVLLLCIGIYKFICVLIPTVNLNHKSIMFFGNIASYNSFDCYHNAVKVSKEEEIDEDLLHQIYAAAVICNQKFENHKRGVILSSVGLVLIISWLIISFFIYYI